MAENTCLKDMEAELKKTAAFIDYAKGRFEQLDQLNSILKSLVQSVDKIHLRLDQTAPSPTPTASSPIPVAQPLASYPQTTRTAKLDFPSFESNCPMADSFIAAEFDELDTDMKKVNDFVDDPNRDNPKIAGETDSKGDDYVLAPNKEGNDGIGTECYDSTPILALMVSVAFVIEPINEAADLNLLLEDPLHYRVNVVLYDNLILSESTPHCVQKWWSLELSMGEPPPILFVSSHSFHHFLSRADSNFVFDPGVEFCWPYCHTPSYSPISPVVLVNALLVLLPQYIENKILWLVSTQGTILHLIEMPTLCLFTFQGAEINKTMYILQLYYLGTRADEYDNKIVVVQVISWVIDTMLTLHVRHDIVQDLYGLGARKSGVTSLPTLGCLPVARTLFGSHENGCVSRLNIDAQAFNNKIISAVANLQTQLPRLKIIVFDIFKPLTDLVQSPANYGFVEARRGCCGTGTIETTSLLCNPKSPGTCANATQYVFGDNVHPSQAANQVLTDGHHDFHDFISLPQRIPISTWRDWSLSVVPDFFASLFDAKDTNLVPLISSTIYVINLNTLESGLQLFLHFEFIFHIYMRVGFPYTNKSSDLFTRGDRRTAEDAYTFLVNWFERFPQYRHRKFYITGESYASHYVPQLAQIFYQKNRGIKNPIISYKGFMVGNVVPDDYHDYIGTYEYWWTHGLISYSTYWILRFACTSGSSQYPTIQCMEALRVAVVEQVNIDAYSIYTQPCNSTALLRHGLRGRYPWMSQAYDPWSERILAVCRVQHDNTWIRQFLVRWDGPTDDSWEHEDDLQRLASSLNLEDKVPVYEGGIVMDQDKTDKEQDPNKEQAQNDMGQA